MEEMTMTTWQRLTIYITESEQWQGKMLYTALVETARDRGIAGATVLRGIEGFGLRDQGRVHTAKIFELSSNLPIMVIMIDREEAIANFLPIVKQMVSGGLVTLEPLNVVHHSEVKE
jgi:hypothetical protein